MKLLLTLGVKLLLTLGVKLLLTLGLVVGVWGTDLGGGDVNGRWYAGGGGLVAVVVLSTGRGDIVGVIVWGADLGGGEVNGRCCCTEGGGLE